MIDLEEGLVGVVRLEKRSSIKESVSRLVEVFKISSL